MTQIAVVFGATGLVGKELVFELLEDARFLKIKAVVRAPLPLSNPKLEQVVVKDYSSLYSLSQQLSADVFFCCIGTTIKKAGTQDAFRKVDFDIPVSISSLAEQLKVPAFIVVSSVGANRHTFNFYLRTKGEMEQEVQKIYQGNLKFLRPSLLLGSRPEFRLGEKFAQVMMKILGIMMIGPFAKYKGVYAWSVARGMIKAMYLPQEKIFIESDEIVKLAGERKTPGKHEIIRIK